MTQIEVLISTIECLGKVRQMLMTSAEVLDERDRELVLCLQVIMDELDKYLMVALIDEREFSDLGNPIRVLREPSDN